jgi:hypothetical protein
MKTNFKKYDTIEEQNQFESVKFADEEMAEDYKKFMDN